MSKKLLKKLIYYPVIWLKKGFYCIEHFFDVQEKDKYKGWDIFFIKEEKQVNLMISYHGSKSLIEKLENVIIELEDENYKPFQEIENYVCYWFIAPASLEQTKGTGKKNYEESLKVLMDTPLTKTFGDDINHCFTWVYVYTYIPKEFLVCIEINTNEGFQKYTYKGIHKKKIKWF